MSDVRATSGAHGARADVLMVDNYDSFTYNLVQYLEELGASVHVRRHDALTCERRRTCHRARRRRRLPPSSPMRLCASTRASPTRPAHAPAARAQ